MVLPFILLYFFTLPVDLPNATNTSLYFNIVVKDKIVGSLKAAQNSKGSKTNYHSSTTIKTRIIKDISVNHRYDVTFVNNILKKADVNITVNKKPHTKTVTQWENNRYQVIKNDKNLSVLKDSIDYATILLYFKEPIGVDRCYSEQDGSFNTIISLGNHMYKKLNSKGKENVYYYKDGALKKAIIDGGLVDFEITAKD
ncbi:MULTISPECIES: DUF6134 family protein [unclassified Maribacter]|uniref:DUF6134 family protein n=1 Tax=unclassified Maribacter TaxID=2615042 RepID=UPI00257966E0|nr:MULTISPECIES: DUF6134 family protein [unclassified Maribacter]|tara:strand:- start:4846 stop:5439 length:594 start_codon:yes stop_codon:yes gene_type:complete